MQKLITTPILLEESIGDFQMRFSEISIRQAALKNLSDEERLDAVQGFLAMAGPLVSLSMPQWWNLSPYIRQYAINFPDTPGLPGLISLLRESEVYIVRMGCSFYPDVERPIKTASFSGYFQPQLGKKEITILDVLPQEVEKTGAYNAPTRWEVHVDLTFSPVGHKSDPSLFGIEFKRLIPHIEPERRALSKSGWIYESQDVEGLLDSRYGYFLVQKPRLAKHILLRQDLTVEVQTSLGLLSAGIRDKDRPLLSHIICSEWIEV